MKIRAKRTTSQHEAYGWVIAKFKNTSGAERLVFEYESPAGMLHVCNGNQIEEVLEVVLDQDPMSIRCPFCFANPYELCTVGGDLERKPHESRIYAALGERE